MGLDCISGREALISGMKNMKTNTVVVKAETLSLIVTESIAPASMGREYSSISASYLCITPGEREVGKEKLLEALKGTSCQVVRLKVRERLGDLGVWSMASCGKPTSIPIHRPPTLLEVAKGMAFMPIVNTGRVDHYRVSTDDREALFSALEKEAQKSKKEGE